MAEPLTIEDLDLIFQALGYQKQAFAEYKDYPTYEFKQAQVARVEPYKSEIIPEVTSRWQQVSNRLVPLNEILEVKPALHVKAKGAGTDSSHQNVPRYKITVGSECWSEKSRGPVYRVLQAAGKGTNSVSDTGPTRTIIGTVVHRSGVWLRGGRKSHTPIGGRPVTLTLGGFGFKREALC